MALWVGEIPAQGLGGNEPAPDHDRAGRGPHYAGGCEPAQGRLTPASVPIVWGDFKAGPDSERRPEVMR